MRYAVRVRSPLLMDFDRRGLIVDVTAADELDEHLSGGSRTAYVGFDPTADSLHVGSLLPLLTLRRLQLAGHRPVVLVGGGTGLIGDPSGKAGERALNPKDRVAEWAERLKAQVRPFLDFDRGSQAALLVDNYSWLSQLDVIGFLRDVGKHFPVGAMLARESVKARMGAGISYTEFSYQVLQAYDFMSLSVLHDCTLQLGGSDQWGNITAGVELIRRVHARPAYGLTLPLVTKSDGTKLGKTESGTVWLDPRKTSAYEMYQFWLNTADADAVRFLRYFTFHPHERIAELEEAMGAAPDKREAQRTLAREVTGLVHGDASVRQAEEISAALFSGDVASLQESQLAQAARGMPTSQVGVRDVSELSWPDLLVRVGLADSKRNARELLGSGSVQLNGRRLDPAAEPPSAKTALFGKYLILRKGKKTYHALELDEKFPPSA
jgi:tyrosyl-tRNA synthetase